MPELPTLREFARGQFTAQLRNWVKLRAYNFLIVIDGYEQLTVAGFQEARGLDDALEQLKLPEPGRFQPHTFPRQIDGRTITLMRGLDFEQALSDWIREVREWEPGKPDYRKSLSIYLMHQLGPAMIAARGWDIFDAWPTAWSGPGFNSMGEQLAFETVTLYCETIIDAPLASSAILNV